MCRANEILIKDWEHFEKIIAETEADFQKFEEQDDRLHISRQLFRGQADANWELETTLERFLGKNISVEEYCRLLRRIQPIIESCTSNHWQLPEVEDDLKELSERGTILMPSYKFMAYLRHHQFPSSFLDWTRSPYIAVFFAFSEDRKTDAAFYIYFNSSTGSKKFCSYFSQIPPYEKGKYARTHKRHHLQQSEYTFCIRGSSLSSWKYASHKELFSLQKNGTGSLNGDYWIGRGEQDILKKYIFPYSQRKYFLNKLNQMNINAYSLFRNEEGLMHKLAIEELLLKIGKDKEIK